MSNLNDLLGAGDAVQPSTGNAKFESTGGNSFGSAGLFVLTVESAVVILPSGEEVTDASDGNTILSKFTDSVPTDGPPGLKTPKIFETESLSYIQDLDEPAWVGATLKIVIDLGPSDVHNPNGLGSRLNKELYYKIAK
jgi:hypothetical protein